MSQPSDAPFAGDEYAAGDRLDSWKSIADYLGKGVTTVRRWEREEGLPVHRQKHSSRGSIVAFKPELDAWRLSRTDTILPEPPAKQLRWPYVTAAIVIPLVLGGLLVRSTASPQRPTPVIDRLITVTGDRAADGPPDLSPSGSHVVFARSDAAASGIYVKPVDGGAAIRIADSSTLQQHPRWSPDGKQILLSELQQGRLHLYTISADGTGRKPVFASRFASPPTPFSPTWMPNGEDLILTDKDDDAQPWSLYRLHLKSGQRTRLTFPPSGTMADVMPAPSPYGSMLAFARYFGGSEADIFLQPSNSPDARRLTADRSYIHGLAWEPGGQAIVYGANRFAAHGRIWRVPADGSGGPELLPGPGEDATYPSYAVTPAQVRLAYHHTGMAVDLRFWQNPPASSPISLAPSHGRDLAAQFSPSGERIAFVSNRDGSREIFVTQTTGASLVRLTTNAGTHTDSPRWSPDGARLAFTTSVNDNRDVYLIPSTGGTPTRLTAEPSEEGRPSWSRDGKSIYCRSNRSGSEQIWKIAVDGSAPPKQITPAGGYESFESFDGQWLYFTKARSQPGLWRVPSWGGPEEFIAPAIREGWWSITASDVFYIANKPNLAIWRLALAAPASRPALVADIHTFHPAAWTGFSARHDGLAFLYSQTASEFSNIAAVEFKPR